MPANSRGVKLRRRLFCCISSALLLVFLCGCAGTSVSRVAPARPFDFAHDTFAYANELVWEYGYDSSGKWTSHAREPKPDYTHHCFVVARSARQFFLNARFDPTLPHADEKTCRNLVRQVIDSNPRRALDDEDRIVIPGFANLREFSQAHEPLLKEECGSWWQSYCQRGHWRMVFPFTRAHQASAAEKLQSALSANRPVILHVVRFPQLSINHAVVAYDARITDGAIEFAVYDPNKPERPVTLTYDNATRTFSLPTNDYFKGGRVDIYEIFKNLLY